MNQRQYIRSSIPPTRFRFDMTSLVDVVFILVLFFAVSTDFSRHHRGVTLTLPSAVSSESSKDRVVISIDKQQRVYWNGRRISEKTISKQVQMALRDQPNQAILLQADQHTPYIRVVSVLDAIRLAGGVNVMLETDRRSR